jgi:hypothetical protein
MYEKFSDRYSYLLKSIYLVYRVCPYIFHPSYSELHVSENGMIFQPPLPGSQFLAQL